MNYPGARRYINIGDGDWTVYIRDTQGIWYPVDIGGPGYLTDSQVDKEEWTMPR